MKKCYTIELVMYMKKKIVIMLLLLCTLLTGCGKDTYGPVKPGETGNKDNKEPVANQKLKIVDVNSKSRPVAVMINNLSAARPVQSGVMDAYIVYEIIVEGGITRYMAVYKDKDTAKIGTVRSSRDYYLDYALENDAIYVHFGWSPQAQELIGKLGVNNINGLYDNAFWRDNPMNLAYEHTAYTSMDKIMKVAKNKGYRLTSEKDLLLNYSVDEVSIENEEGSLKADNVSIRYSNAVTTSYKYNPTDKLYYRSVNGSAQKDYVTKKQYTTKNIIISYVDNENISNDNKGRQELNNIGTGKGYYITDGYSIPITWTKTSRNEQTVYKKLNGEEITVNDGNTFIQIAPKDSAKIS